MNPQWSVSDEVLVIFHARTKAERERLLALFSQVATSPANSADYQRIGPDGRLYSVAYLKSWMISYWVDPDRNLVRFVELEFVR